MVTPPAFQLLKFNSLDAKERKPSKSATLKTRQGDGNRDTLEPSGQKSSSMICAQSSALRPFRKTLTGVLRIHIRCSKDSAFESRGIIADGRSLHYIRFGNGLGIFPVLRHWERSQRGSKRRSPLAFNPPMRYPLQGT